MPWAPKDASSHTRAANTAKKRRQWAHVANSARERCIKQGGSEKDCDARAIKQANTAVKKARGEGQGVGGPRQGDGGPAYCVCPKCGAKVKHTSDEPCKQQRCPKCGAAMQPQEKGFSSTFGESEGAGLVTEHCVCPECGYESRAKADTMCEESRCPKCGTRMIAKEHKSIPMRVTKATVRDGRMYWQGVISDDDWDYQDERLDLSIFRHFEGELEAQRQKADYQPPFLSLSHYNRLDGIGERGVVENLWHKGRDFYADGWFNDDPLSKRCFEVVRAELERQSAGEKIDRPTRFSIAFWAGETAEDAMGRTAYLTGDFDHVALTRVPVNPRTRFTQATEKSMTTPYEDALSVIGEDAPDEVREQLDELEEKRRRTHKSEVDDDLVIKSDEEDESPAIEEHREQELALKAYLENEGYEPEAIEKAQWNYAYKKALPDSAYAYVEKGGGCAKVDGKTPQKCRHLPYKDKSGSIDCGHTRAALQAVGGARTGKKMSVPSGVVAKLKRALKSCQKSTKSEALEIELTEYEQGCLDGYNRALDLDIPEEVDIMADETKETKAEVEEPKPIDLDEVVKVLKPDSEPEQKAETEPPDKFEVHTDLLRQIVTAEGYGREKKKEAAEAVLRSFAAHVSNAIDEVTPASPEDIAKAMTSQMEEAIRPLMDRFALMEEAVMGKKPDAPKSKALSLGGKESFEISPEETLRKAREGGEVKESRARQIARASVGLDVDQPL
jgi:DNA-directed RNA polymerase subunit RPC12/RpoP